MKSAENFFQTIMYPGKDESAAEIGSRMYEKQKQESSCNLITAQSSLHEHLKRAKIQTKCGTNAANKLLCTQTLLTKVGWRKMC